jgi:pimeloyl-ACP methyl ester carboxylesterase
MSTKPGNPADFIVSLNLNGLEGRMLRLPAKNKKNNREILFIYGQHSSLERWFGIAQELSKYGNVTMPDLPGLGGMTSLYHIHQSATIDNMADYLATFIKLKYKNKKFTIAGMSLGFVIVTRMLQKYPELVKKVDDLISIVGFVHRDDFHFTKRRMLFYKIASRIFSRKWPSKVFKHTALRPSVLNAVYHRTHNAKEKFAAASGDEFRRTMDVEIGLWQMNDIRTQFKNYLEMFYLDNTKVPVALPVYHVAAKNDRYFNNVKVEENMRRIFTDFKIFYSKTPNHAPTVIATAKEASPFIPPGLKKILAGKKSK